MIHPTLKFHINENEDIEIYLGFWESSKYYSDLKKDLNCFFYNLYPQLKSLKKKENDTKKIQTKEVSKFVNKFYQENEPELRQQMIAVKKYWQENKSKFFKVTNKIFKNHEWPQGNYISYITIWGIFPRFLNNKTFCIPYKSKNKKFILAVIVHELLHFIFYDYAIKKYPKIFKKLDTERGIFWDLAEIFNVVMHKTELIKIHGKMDNLVYPSHKKLLPYFLKLWKKNKDIDIWLKQGFEFLRKKQTEK